MDYQPIENCGIIGNMRTVTLVGMNISNDGFCDPDFDSAKRLPTWPRLTQALTWTRCWKGEAESDPLAGEPIPLGVASHEQLLYSGSFWKLPCPLR